MKAVVYQNRGVVTVEEVEQPRIVSPTDAVIRVTSAAICASDVHVVKEGDMIARGCIMGHEYCGEVVEIGSAVAGLKSGDRVAGSPVYNCGRCYYCRRNQQSLCERGQCVSGPENQGTQAEYAKIPYADNTLIKIPDGLSDEDVIFTGDILSTGFSGLLKSNTMFGDIIGVFGAGPVGLCSVASAPLFGTGMVIAVDILDYRLEVARRFGAITIDAAKEDSVARIKELTDGRGVDVGIECAGLKSTLDDCFKSTRRGGTVSILGTVPDAYKFDLSERFFDMFNLNIGFGDQNHREDLIALIKYGKLDLKPLITHILPLDDAPRAYEIFDKKLENCIKIILKP